MTKTLAVVAIAWALVMTASLASAQVTLNSANTNLRLVIMHRDSDALKDPVPHVIFNVTDMAATVAAIKAAGGTMDGEPRPFGTTGIVIGIAIDPVGNRLELIQRK